VAVHDLQRDLIDECVEDHAEGRLSRRDALKLLAGFTGVGLACRILDARAQKPKSARSEKPASAPSRQLERVVPARVAPDDPEIVASSVRFSGPSMQVFGYLARPARDGAFPIVLVGHENRGLTPHIEDVTRRLAKAGYVGLSVDLLSVDGGTAKLSPDKIPDRLASAKPSGFVRDFASGLAYAKKQPFARADRVGVVGFGLGGGVTWSAAAAIPELRAAVPFYGLPVSADEVPRIKAAVLAIYAGRDDRINAHIPAIEVAMQQNGKTFRKIVYPDVDHAFHDDTGERYGAAAAKGAWDETLAWFRQYLDA